MIKAPSFPFAFNDNKGFLNHSSSKDAIRFHLTNLFLTNPGEKISDGSYGIGMRRYLFENGTEGITDTIDSRIRQQLSTYMPYIQTNQVNGDFAEETNTLAVSLSYTILETSEDDVLTFEVGIVEQSSLTYWGKINANKTKDTIH